MSCVEYKYNKLSKMISPQINQIIYRNRQAQKPKIIKEQILYHINKQLYQGIINYTNNVNFTYKKNICSFVYQICSLIQFFQQNLLKKYTLVFAKNCFHEILKKISSLSIKNVLLLYALSIWTAIKLKQSQDIRLKYTAQVITSIFQSQFSVQELKKAQTQIIIDSGFILDYTLPYDYMKVFLLCFPQLKNTQTAIKNMIDFALIIPQLDFHSSQNIFYASVDAIFKIKNYHFNSTQSRLLKKLIKNKLIITEISDRLQQQLNKNLQNDIEIIQDQQK